MKFVILTAALVLASRTDFAAPAQLEDPQILVTQNNPASVLALDEPGDSWLFVVVQGQGGVAYRAVPLEVE
jgi:hypothetical protein